MNDPDAKFLAGLDQMDLREDTIERESISYPYAQWINGDPSLKKLGLGDVSYTGGWFIPADRIDLDVLPGWTKTEITWRDGTTTEGWATRTLRMAVMHSRRCWRITLKEGGRDRQMFFPWGQYDAAREAGAPYNTTPTGRLQVLGIIAGLETMGPMMLTLGGTAGKAAGEALADFKHLVLDSAPRFTNRKVKSYPRYRFWMEIGPETDANGQPVFTAVGSGAETTNVTLPTLIGVTRGMSADALQRLLVPAEIVQAIQGTVDEVTHEWNHDGLWDETEAWARAWDELQESKVAGEGASVSESDFTGF